MFNSIRRFFRLDGNEKEILEDRLWNLEHGIAQAWERIRCLSDQIDIQNQELIDLKREMQ